MSQSQYTTVRLSRKNRDALRGLRWVYFGDEQASADDVVGALLEDARPEVEAA